MTETESRWAARVADWRASGQTAPAFCKGKDFSAGGLRYWASRLQKSAPKGEVRLARVVRTPRAKDAIETPIFIELGNARLGVVRGFDPETLRAVLGVFGGGR
jgi:hypothetical protein